MYYIYNLLCVHTSGAYAKYAISHIGLIYIMNTNGITYYLYSKLYPHFVYIQNYSFNVIICIHDPIDKLHHNTSW